MPTLTFTSKLRRVLLRYTTTFVKSEALIHSKWRIVAGKSARQRSVYFYVVSIGNKNYIMTLTGSTAYPS